MRDVTKIEVKLYQEFCLIYLLMEAIPYQGLLICKQAVKKRSFLFWKKKFEAILMCFGHLSFGNNGVLRTNVSQDGWLPGMIM